MSRLSILSLAVLGTSLVLSPLALAQMSAPITPTEMSASMSSTQTQNSIWTELLQTYVVEGNDDVNRVDYGALKANAADVAALDAYIAHFSTVDVSTLERDEAFAVWANAYNALTVQHIIGRYPLTSIKSGYFFGGPWKRVKMNVGGRTVSLDQIEHEILRVQWSHDPRLHYAINCASYGCPNLMNRAWEAATLDADLDAAARAYVNHARGVSVRPRGGLNVSEIYKWFQDDFGGSEAGVIAHLQKFAAPELSQQITDNANIIGYRYDWSLNDVEKG